MLFFLLVEFNSMKLNFCSFVIRIYCSMIGSTEEDVLLLDEPAENVYVNIRHTKDFRFVTVNTFSTTFSKVSLSKCFFSTRDPDI